MAKEVDLLTLFLHSISSFTAKCILGNTEQDQYPAWNEEAHNAAPLFSLPSRHVWSRDCLFLSLCAPWSSFSLTQNSVCYISLIFNMEGAVDYGWDGKEFFSKHSKVAGTRVSLCKGFSPFCSDSISPRGLSTRNLLWSSPLDLLLGYCTCHFSKVAI